MNRLIKVGLLVFLVALCFGAEITTHFRQHQPPAPAEHDLYSVVNRQLADFRADDFTSAYEYAASGMQRKFSRTQFERMIRRDFASMTRVARVEFGAIRVADDAVFMQVFLIGSEGTVRGFLYRFMAESGSWKIAGVQSLGPPSAWRLSGLRI
jgi:hypothetical protein